MKTYKFLIVTSDVDPCDIGLNEHQEEKFVNHDGDSLVPIHCVHPNFYDNCIGDDQICVVDHKGNIHYWTDYLSRDQAIKYFE